MVNNNHFEKENFRALIEGDPVGDLEKRLEIIDIFLDTEEHVTLEELVQSLKRKGYDFEPEFVRRCLNRWVELGFAQKKLFEGQPPRYEHRHLGKHHDHLICTKCGKIAEFNNEEMEKLQLKIAGYEGFQVLQHKMEIYGICAECLSKRQTLLPLTMARPGEKIVIKEITGGGEVKARFASLGLRPGDRLEIISNNGEGRLIIGHGQTRLAMGRGMAHKIMVSLAVEED